MIIDDITYALTPNNYIPIDTIKKQIVIGHTFNHDMKHCVGWQNRLNGNYKKTAAFSIDAAGLVYKHFDPIYHSNFFGNKEIDKQTIVILVENDGWLIKDVEKNLFITWIGDIYRGPAEIVEKRWRGYNYWCPYTKKQVESSILLVKELCNEFFIPSNSLNHNTKIDNVMDFEGVLYKSNFEKHYTDLSPSWDYENFKTKIELK